MFNSKRIHELEEVINKQKVIIDHFSKQASLVSIDRVGRTIKFTFVRYGKLHTIETMGLMSDDTTQWEQDLLK